MATLGEKLQAQKNSKEIIEKISNRPMQQEEAEEILQNLLVITKEPALHVDHKGNYYVEEIMNLYDKCSQRVSREYSKKFMNSIALEMMFND